MKQLAEIRSYFQKSQHKILTNNFDKDRDARITIYSKCIVAIDSAELGLALNKYGLLEEDWWTKS